MSSKSLEVAVSAFLFAAGAVLSAQGCGGGSPGAEAGAGDDGGALLGDDGGLGQGGDGQGGAAPQGGGGIGGGGGVPGNGGSGAQGGSTSPGCGEPGMQCCASNGCNGGGCCVSGICMAPGSTCVVAGGGLCSAGVCGNCGGPGLPCCGANPASGTCTAPDTKCNAGFCAQCGNLGFACCPDATGSGGTCKGAGTICSGNTCVGCGTPGSACCPGNVCGSPGCCYNNVCVNESTACGPNGGTCQAGRCSGCGSASQGCCSNSCYDGLLCKNGLCTSCGSAGETCCPAGSGLDRCKAGNACSTPSGDGFCARCGGLGESCCANDACSGGCCSNGLCLAAGTCTTTPDAGVDAPVGGAGGKSGTGGISGNGGVTGMGGATSTGGTTTPPNSGLVMTVSNGQAQGAMTGYGWIALGSADTVTDPTCASPAGPITSTVSCLDTLWSSPTAYCFSGRLPAVTTSADYTTNWGIQLGIDATPVAGGVLGQSFTSLSLALTGSPQGGLRIIAHRKGDTSGQDYCATMAASGSPVLFTNFNTACWDGSGTRLAATDVANLDKLGIQVPSSTSAITVSNLCLIGITFAK
jgi:hypothetical protein